MNTYFVRYEFPCRDVAYKRHMVATVEAKNIFDATAKVRERVEFLGENCVPISIHEHPAIEGVIPRPFWPVK